jgi:hypothetical protein
LFDKKARRIRPTMYERVRHFEQHILLDRKIMTGIVADQSTHETRV